MIVYPRMVNNATRNTRTNAAAGQKMKGGSRSSCHVWIHLFYRLHLRSSPPRK